MLSPLPFPVPLAFDTVYYVESPNNAPLNEAMRQIAQSQQPLFENMEMQPFPFKLLCLTQDELSADRLSADLADKFDPDLVAETIADLRECLHADTGGTLTARCLPKFKDHVRVDDRAVCTLEDFGNTNPEEALDAATMFASSVAKENFLRLTGTSYYLFLEAKEEERNPVLRHGLPGGHIGFLQQKPDPKKVVQDLKEHIEEMEKDIDENTNIDDIYNGIKAYFESCKRKGKMDSICKLKVDWKEIRLILSETKSEEVVFGRGGVARTLYIFFLRLIERAEIDHSDPIYISKPGLEAYQEELLDLYIQISGKYESTVKDIASWWDPSSNDFANALSSIRKFFKQEFDVETLKSKYNKCYTIEIMDRDKFNSDAYGIQLDPSDFDLGRFSLKGFRRIRL